MEDSPTFDVGVSSIEQILRRLSSETDNFSLTLLKEGKLILSVEWIDRSSDFFLTRLCNMRPGQLECQISLGSDSKSIYFSRTFPQAAEIFFFDIFEYYGNTDITFALSDKQPFSTRNFLGQRKVQLANILLAQEKKMCNTVFPQHNISDFWMAEEILFIENEFHTYKLRIRARYIRLQNCLSNDLILQNQPSVIRIPIMQREILTTRSNRILQHFIENGFSDLHNILANLERLGQPGFISVVEDVIETLARQTVLKSALNIRTKHESKSVVDIIAYFNNYRTLRILLQRAGIWGFQGISVHMSCPLHWAVRSYLNDSDPELAIRRRRPGNSATLDIISSISSIFTGYYDDCTECLRILLRFLSKYATSLIGWQTDPTFKEILEWRDENNFTPLMLACSIGNHRAVRVLIQSGADSGAVEMHGRKTPLILATLAGSADAVRELLSDKLSVRAAIDATGALVMGPHNTLNPLSLYKCKPCYIDAIGNQAICIAAERGYLDIFIALLSAGVSHQTKGTCGNNLLHIASMAGNASICALIVERESNRHITRKREEEVRTLVESENKKEVDRKRSAVNSSTDRSSATKNTSISARSDTEAALVVHRTPDEISRILSGNVSMISTQEIEVPPGVHTNMERGEAEADDRSDRSSFFSSYISSALRGTVISRTPPQPSSLAQPQIQSLNPGFVEFTAATVVAGTQRLMSLMKRENNVNVFSVPMSSFNAIEVKHSSPLYTMIPSDTWLCNKNLRGKTAAMLARENDHEDIAAFIDAAVFALYGSGLSSQQGSGKHGHSLVVPSVSKKIRNSELVAGGGPMLSPRKPAKRNSFDAEDSYLTGTSDSGNNENDSDDSDDSDDNEREIMYADDLDYNFAHIRRPTFSDYFKDIGDSFSFFSAKPSTVDVCRVNTVELDINRVVESENDIDAGERRLHAPECSIDKEKEILTLRAALSAKSKECDELKAALDSTLDNDDDVSVSSFGSRVSCETVALHSSITQRLSLLSNITLDDDIMLESVHTSTVERGNFERDNGVSALIPVKDVVKCYDGIGRMPTKRLKKPAVTQLLFRNPLQVNPNYETVSKSAIESHSDLKSRIGGLEIKAIFDIDTNDELQCVSVVLYDIVSRVVQQQRLQRINDRAKALESELDEAPNLNKDKTDALFAPDNDTLTAPIGETKESKLNESEVHEDKIIEQQQTTQYVRRNSFTVALSSLAAFSSFSSAVLLKPGNCEVIASSDCKTSSISLFRSVSDSNVWRKRQKKEEEKSKLYSDLKCLK